MVANNYVNTASEATLSAAITSGGITVNVQNYSGFPAAPYWASIAKGTASHEVVKVTAVAGNVLTVTRGQGGTPASAHSTGDKFEHVAPAYVFELAEDHVELTTAHGTVSDIVGESDTGTLTNKTYRGAGEYVFTDANPVSPTAGFKVTANSAAARDGFAHHNTGGDANRRGFLLDQSGTPRFEVFNDGTVKIVSAAAAARAGLDVIQDIVGDSAIQTRVGAEGVARMMIEAGGKLWWGNGTLAVDTNLYRAAADKLKTDDALDVAGTLGALGALAVTGNETVGGTLGVTGATTLGSVSASSATVSGALSAGSATVGGQTVVPRPLHARKTAIESVTSSTVLQDDDQLFLALEANKTYEVTGVLRYDGSSTGDFKMAFSVPTGTSLNLFLHALSGGAASGSDGTQFVYDDVSNEPTFGATGASAIRGVIIQGLVRLGGTAGNLQLRWAQGASSATATRVLTNSYLNAVILD